MTGHMKRTVKYALILLLLGCLGASISMVTGPEWRRRAYHSGKRTIRVLLGHRERVMREPFTQEMIDEQLYAPVTDVFAIHKKIDPMLVSPASLDRAYENLTVLEQRVSGHISIVEYRLENQRYTAYAYYKGNGLSATAARTAFILMPQTGSNVASNIFYQHEGNGYQDIMKELLGVGDMFVCVRPDEDFLAIHNGKRRLELTFVTDYLINKGGSYSGHHLINTLAVTKWCQANYRKVILLGWSQGGYTAFLNSLQSHPASAVIASGYSILFDTLYPSDEQQVVIPGLFRIYSKQNVFNIISRSGTKYLFTYGKKEDGIYGREARERLTCSFLSKLPSVTCAIHDEGHIIQRDIVLPFLYMESSQPARN